MFKPRGHRAIFTFFCNDLLKTCFWCYRTRKLPHILKLYFGNFYRAFTKSNNSIAAMLISVISMPIELWSCWGIHEQFEVFYCVKHFCIQAVGKLITDWRYCSFAPPILLINPVHNFQLINNHIKTWVWKSMKMKLLALKVFWDLDKTS